MLSDWHELFVATAGAAAALAGLIIVAMSINIQLIISIPGMASRAGATIACIVLVLFGSIVALIPDQPLPLLGTELTIGVLALLAIGTQSAVEMSHTRGTTLRTAIAAKAGLILVPACVIAVGSGLLIADNIAGLGVVVSGFLVGFVFSIVNTWVLMVEILR